MLLALDVGNTQTVIGLYASPSSVEPIITWRLRTNKAAASDDIKAKLLPLFSLEDISTTEVESVVMASVVPALTSAWKAAIRGIWGLEALACTAEAATRAGLFDAAYANPAEIGQDRVADAVAARERFGSPTMIVDFGTATNIEAIDEAGSFVGGVIAPGLRTGADALFSHATKLAATELVAPDRVIGSSTEEAIRSGLVLGEACRADALIRSMMAELGVRAKREGGACSVVATGGFAELVSPHSAVIDIVEPNLTLEGLRLVMQRTNEEGSC